MEHGLSEEQHQRYLRHKNIEERLAKAVEDTAKQLKEIEKLLEERLVEAVEGIVKEAREIEKVLRERR